MGPTYRLNVEGPPGIEAADLRATLESVEWGGVQEPSTITAPVRTQGGPWVRFGPLSRPPASGPPWLLQLRKAPDVFGQVEVFRVPVGVHPGVLDVRLDRLGEIHGLVWNDDDDVPLAGALVTLQMEDGLPRVAPDRAARVDDRGSFRFEGLDAGTYHVGAVAEGYPYDSARMEVVPGQPATHEFRLSRERAFGSVSGKLISVTGATR